ncbi:MAG: hypothetical protein L0241_08710 [Planctomycetia bacterium]|nr:hypothetical protein [Planctomycetia bacterium]
MILLKCDKVTRGLRASEETAVVSDAYGVPDFIRVEQGFLSQRGMDRYLPVSLIDREGTLLLVEFPQESERGNNRVWVRAEQVVEKPRRASA